MKRFNDKGQEIYDFNLNEEQLRRLNKYATKKLAANHRSINEALKHVNGDVNQPLLSREFEANAQRTRDMNKAMGHDRDEVLRRTIALNYEDERKAEEETLSWKMDRKDLDKIISHAEKKTSRFWLFRLIDWIDSKIPSPNEAFNWRDRK